MIIQLIKQMNPEHPFYIPYLRPIKSKIEQENRTIELVDYMLPKEAQVFADEQGAEAIFIDGLPVQVMTDVFTGLVYLMNSHTCLRMDRHINRTSKGGNLVAFPIDNKMSS